MHIYTYTVVNERERDSLDVCVRARVHACVRACVRACMCASVRASERACARACVRACERACMCYCVDELGIVIFVQGRVLCRHRVACVFVEYVCMYVCVCVNIS